MRNCISKFNAPANAVYLFRRYDGRSAFVSYQADNVGQSEQSHSLAKRNARENIAGKERHFECDAPVFPLPQRAIARKKMFHVVARQALCRFFFLVGANE